MLLPRVSTAWQHAIKARACLLQPPVSAPNPCSHLPSLCAWAEGGKRKREEEPAAGRRSAGAGAATAAVRAAAASGSAAAGGRPAKLARGGGSFSLGSAEKGAAPAPEDVPAASEPATRALRIDGFVRPFHERQVGPAAGVRIARSLACLAGGRALA